MVGKVTKQTVRQRVKAAANWRCQNPDCQRECLRPGETLAELLARQRLEPERKGQLELDWRSRANAIQPYIMKAMPDGDGGYLALCGSCAIHFIQPSPPPRFQQTKLELLGQLRLLSGLVGACDRGLQNSLMASIRGTIALLDEC